MAKGIDNSHDILILKLGTRDANPKMCKIAKFG
jgi:hypothetical protein